MILSIEMQINIWYLIGGSLPAFVDHWFCLQSKFGETVQREATEYLIRRPEIGLEIGDTEKVDLSVKFNTSFPAPRLIGIRLNARVVCPDNGIIIKPEIEATKITPSQS